jgi:hypothetical protein
VEELVLHKLVLQSQNILSTDAGGATIGSAFAKSTLEQDPSRQKELDRAGTMAEKLEEIDAAIATAQADGDLQRAKMLLEQRNKLAELNIKRGNLAVKRKAAELDNFFKFNKLKTEQTKALTEIAEKIAKAGIQGDAPLIRSLIDEVFEKYPIDDATKEKIIQNTIAITSPSATTTNVRRGSREQTASGD